MPPVRHVHASGTQPGAIQVVERDDLKEGSTPRA